MSFFFYTLSLQSWRCSIGSHAIVMIPYSNDFVDVYRQWQGIARRR